MTQEELANLLFVSRQLISKWENNKSYPDLNQLIQLSDYFDLSLDELMRGDKQMIKKKDAQVKTGEKGKKIIIIVLALFILISLYFGITILKTKHLYRNVEKEDWEDIGIAYTLNEDDIQYAIYKTNKYNIFSMPKTLTIVATPIKSTPINTTDNSLSLNNIMLYFNGDKEDFYITWLGGNLIGQTLQMDSEFIYKKELQPMEKQTISYEFEKIFNEELDIERPFLEPFLNKVDKKWQDINQ